MATSAERRERGIARIRNDILAAAARAVSRRGLEATTVHDIAREAGYTTQTLYAYFQGRQQIIDGLVATMRQQMEACFQVSGDPGTSFRQRLEALYRRQLALAEQWQEAYPVVFAVRMAADPTAVAMRQGRSVQGLKHADPYQQRLVQWMRDNARPGDIGGHDPADAAWFLLAITSSFFFRWMQGDRSQPLAASLETALDFFFHGICGPSEPRLRHRCANTRSPEPPKTTRKNSSLATGRKIDR